ncbi:MAG TPA: hypothetical protein PKD24_07450 [Pyrinomonadaceae bacterium]|nr:hypothetical protein [Pyrinomonadaceae bacterium]
MSFELNSAVHNDLREAIEHYDDTARSKVAIDFYREFLRFAGLAAEAPRAFRIYENDPTEIRRVNFRRFPYHFLFRQVGENAIRILVVRHDHRHPSYGLDRW